MSSDPDFESILNHYEQPVLRLVNALAPEYPMAVEKDLLADVACVALNRLPARYIRHPVDLAFYMSEKERVESERAIEEAVQYAFGFVQARVAMRARG
jgi:hypothetical protein